MREPQEVQDEAHEQLVARVAAIDVAKASGMVCTRVLHASAQGRRVTRVWEVPATTGAIIELGGHLAGLGVEKVTPESTSNYWRVFFYLLEAAGLEVQLVNARTSRTSQDGQERQARQRVAGEADRAGHAAAQLRAPR